MDLLEDTLTCTGTGIYKYYCVHFLKVHCRCSFFLLIHMYAVYNLNCIQSVRLSLIAQLVELHVHVYNFNIHLNLHVSLHPGSSPVSPSTTIHLAPSSTGMDTYSHVHVRYAHHQLTCSLVYTECCLHTSNLMEEKVWGPAVGC